MKRVVPVLLALLVGVACSDDPPAAGSSSGGGPGGDGGATTDPVIAPSGGSVRAPYEVKTSAEIRAAVDACFGPGVTTVAASMIQSPQNPGGFLSARQFAAGSDVIAGEVRIIDGDPSVERVGVRNATLSLPILAALQDIGNVVGENCKSKGGSGCTCETKEAAHAMLTRCLPSIAPSKFATLEDSFAEACARDRAAAIASLLASTAFGVR